MRIVGGSMKGLRFSPPGKLDARPTTDFAKEAIFNILHNYFDFSAIRFLDLFAGTGNMSFEMYSRGCRHITAVDKSPRSVRYIREMSEAHGMDIEVQRDNAWDFVRNHFEDYDIAFADPPYDLEGIGDLPDLVLNSGILRPGGWFILETGAGQDFEGHEKLFNLRQYGQSRFWIFSLPDQTEQTDPS